jgi:sugar phosphate isomerase/epimerase
MNLFRYGVACALDAPSPAAPIVLRGGIEQICETCRKVGYEGIEIQSRDPQKFDWEKIRKTTEEYGLSVCALATGREFNENRLWLLDPDANARRTAINKLKLHIDLAGVLGSMVIVGSMRKDIPDFSRYDYYLGLHNEAISELAEYAAPKGVTIVLENILTFTSNFMCTAKQTADAVRMIGKENVRTHLDSFSMLMEDNEIAESYEYSAPELAYVHFSDSARLYPGGGNVNFFEHMKALQGVGYKGWVTIECIPWPDEFTCAKRSLDYLKATEVVLDNHLSARNRGYVQLEHSKKEELK